MMINFLKRLFDYNEKQLNRYRQIVNQINNLEDQARKITDDQFKKETNRLKNQVSSGKKLEDILPWAFALVREASRRLHQERHFDVQLMAGIALFEGKIVEQKTGEGKTLSATTALYLHALTGKGVHLVTVNDYLARRDCGWMGEIFDFLGLKTAAIIADQSFIYDPNYKNEQAQDWRLVHLKPITRREAYQADITYGINSEFGFDYLRDNMARTPEDLVQRNFYYAIIDEADSILIDEARTPHIISAPFDEDVSKYYHYAQLIKKLDPNNDFKIDEKSRSANLTEEGIRKVEKILGVENIYEKDFDTLFHIEAAIKAEALFKKDKDYIVKDNQVIIVDEFTGRLLYGHRFSEGLHQAIEAKENVPIQKESKTLATISLQNYFRMYEKIAGMTGTAATEAEEFNKIYKTEVVVIPTHRPMIRRDHPDVIYKREKGKFEAVIEDIIENYKNGRPVLVGTNSIEKNEYLSYLLNKKGVPHQVLNAKHHEKEASIIAQAGKKGSVTIATNMAGRGVDIILGGMPPNKYDLTPKDYELEQKNWLKAHDEVVQLGGLYVIGTERNESRRIDNQLRGRSGRQGDPGESRFYISLEDDLMRIFGGEQISNLMTFFNFPEDQPLSHPMVSRAIEQAQKKVEGYNFDIRKYLVEYDDVLNKQRQVIYARRKNILLSLEKDINQFKELIFDIFEEEISTLVNKYELFSNEGDKESLEAVKNEFKFLIPFSYDITKNFKTKNSQEIINELVEGIKKEYLKRENKYQEIIWNNVVRGICLSIFDKYWTDHLTAIDDLREGIGLRGYAQLDPLVEYKNEAYNMFERLINQINYELTRRLFRIEISAIQEEKPIQDNLVYQSAGAVDVFKGEGQTPLVNQSESSQPFSNQESLVSGNQFFKITLPGQKTRKIGRNDPCWCGSGKKYKKCHYPN